LNLDAALRNLSLYARTRELSGEALRTDAVNLGSSVKALGASESTLGLLGMVFVAGLSRTDAVGMPLVQSRTCPGKKFLALRKIFWELRPPDLVVDL
jgi:hypothetical protein